MDIEDGHYNYNRNLLAGCSLIILVFVVGLVTVIALGVSRDRQSARYPGSLAIASHSNYSGLPFAYRWDDTYLTTDNFTVVYNWYSTTFNLGAERRAMEKCIQLEGNNPQLVASRQISVLLCNTPQGQMIFVTRSTAYR